MSAKNRIEVAVNLISSLEKELDELDALMKEKKAELRKKAIELANLEVSKMIKGAEEVAEKVRKELEEEGRKEAERILAEGRRKAEMLKEEIKKHEAEIKELITRILLGEE